MNIRGWFIDGFGVFRDYEVQGLSDGLTVFVGPNEAGKSTLLWFLRGMLFGFPDGRRALPQFPPVHGGRHGGRVIVADGATEYVVDRDAGRRKACTITTSGGEAVAPEAFARLCGGADDHLFCNVYAFSLSELESFESLAANGVRERIFSAGIAGAGRSARDVIRNLTERATRLLKRTGQARVNALVSDLRAAQQRGEAARQAARTYADRVAEEAQARALVDTLGARIETLRAERARCRLLSELSPVWTNLMGGRAALAALPRVDDFPADPEARLAEVRHGLEAARGVLEELMAEERAAAEQRRALHPDDRIHAGTPEVERLTAELALYRERVQQLPAARQQRQAAENELRNVLTELGPGWDAPRVAGVDRSIARREELRRWSGQLDAMSREVEGRRGERDAAWRSRGEAAARIEELEAQGPSVEPPARVVLDESLAVISRLRIRMLEHRAESAELSARESVARDREAMLGHLADGAPRLYRVLLSSTGLVMAAGLGAGGWHVATFGLAESYWMLAVVAAVVVGGAVAIGSLVRRRRRHRKRYEAVEIELTALRGALDARRVELDGQERSIAADAALVGLAAAPTLESLEERARYVARQIAERTTWDHVDMRRRDARAELDAADQRLGACDESLAGAEAARAAAEDAWARWKEAAALPLSLTASGALEFLDGISRARAAIETHDHAKRSASELGEHTRAWETAVYAAADRAGGSAKGNAPTSPEPASPGDTAVRVLDALRERLRRDAEVRRTVGRLAEEERNRSGRISAARAAVERWLAERDALFAEGGAADEGEFRRRLEIVRQQRELTSTLGEGERALRARVGDGPEAEAVQAELQSGCLEEWLERGRRLEREIAECHEARDRAVRHHRDAETARRMLEESADVAMVDGEREAIQSELRAAVREWRVLTLARSLVEETLRDFERSRQPAVLAQASRAFADVTGGRYERVVQGDGDAAVAVLDREGRLRSIDTLSRGTAEQLYVCIRLGLAAEFTRRSVSLPLVMDDILVNFDPGRARALAEVLGAFATTHQILLFTCHPATRDLISEVVPTARVIELPGNAAAGRKAPSGTSAQVVHMQRVQPGSARRWHPTPRAKSRRNP